MIRLAPVGLTVALLAAVAPAIAAQDHTITATNNVFTEDDITIAVGDRVLFRNNEGSHNFVFEDGRRYPQNPTPSGDAVWSTLSRTFDAAGTYPYYCAAHGGPGGSGMSGTIRVTGAPTPSPTPTATPTPSATPAPTPGPSGGTPGAPAVRVRSLTAGTGRFCARRGPNCRRPGVRLRIDLSTPARVTGVLNRRAKRFGRVDFGTVAAGPRTLRFQRTSSGKRLRSGRYTLAVSVDGVAVKTLRFRVR